MQLINVWLRDDQNVRNSFCGCIDKNRKIQFDVVVLQARNCSVRIQVITNSIQYIHRTVWNVSRSKCFLGIVTFLHRTSIQKKTTIY